MIDLRPEGLFAAVLTPFSAQGQLHLESVKLMVDWLIRRNVGGLFVCGTTGEGPSLTVQERMRVAEAYVKATAKRVPVFIHVGHDCIEDSTQLARHAANIGADAVASVAPWYFPIQDVTTLVDTMSVIASHAPTLPFYYYHIPSLTGVRVRPVQFLESAADKIPNLAGIKFTAPELDEYQECVEFRGGRYNIFWGRDEMLLSALNVGAKAAIGSTMNVASPLYHRMITAFQENDRRTAGELQLQAVQLIRMLSSYPFLPALKTIINRFGFNYGACRLPLGGLSEQQIQELKRRIDALPFLG